MENIAVIKFDANLIKLTIATVSDTGNFIIKDELSENIKIGQDLDRDGLILKSKINESIIILKSFNKIISSNKCVEVFPVITSSLKDAKNIKSFLEEVRSSTGLNFKILDKKDEIENIYLSVVNSIDIPKGIIVNIGSENTQFIMYNRKKIIQVAQIEIGDYTLAKQFADTKLSASQINKTMVEMITSELSKIEWLKTIEEDVQFVGTGNTFLTLAKLARKITKYPVELEHSYIFTKADFEKTYSVLKDLGMDKTKKLKGISNTRADVLTSGMNIVGSIMKYLKFENITLSRFNYTDGVIFGFASSKKNVTSSIDVLGASLQTINEFLDNDYRNDEIYELSVLLYKQLRVLHKLPRQFTKILRMSVYMHSCGEKISFANKERNAFNIILNSDILGASHREIVLAAFIVASQELDNFSRVDWVKYKDIFVEGDLDAVKKLAIILRLAICFDKSKSNVIKDINCDTLGDSVILKTIVDSDATLEMREALKVQADFKKSFNYNLEVL